MRKKMMWIKVQEKLPEDMEYVLFTDGKDVFKGYRMSSELDVEWDYWYSISDTRIEDVTDWMPLPELPKE